MRGSIVGSSRQAARLVAVTLAFGACTTREVDQPSNKLQPAVYEIGATVAAPGVLPSCTAGKAGSTAFVKSPPTLWKCAGNGWSPILCNAGLAGALAYESATGSLYACTAHAWLPVPLPAGPQGPAGPEGPAGISGVAGPAGSNGSALRVAREPGGAACASGGQRIDVGIDANANATLDDAEVQQTVFLCDGKDGAAGERGEVGPTGPSGVAGASALVRSMPEPAGATCPTGGVRFVSGTDVDGDGTLDQDEVTATSYACNGVEAGGGGGAAGGGAGGSTAAGGFDEKSTATRRVYHVPLGASQAIGLPLPEPLAEGVVFSVTTDDPSVVSVPSTVTTTDADFLPSFVVHAVAYGRATITVSRQGMTWTSVFHVHEPDSCLVVNEIGTASAGGDDCRADFIELLNRCDAPVQLVGLTLHYVSLGTAQPPTELAKPSDSIGAHGYYVTNSFTGLGDRCLRREGGGVQLRRGMAVIDSVGYGVAASFVESKPVFPGSLPGCMARVPDGRDTNDNSVDFAIAGCTAGVGSFP